MDMVSRRKAIDAVIIVIMILIAGIVLWQVGFIPSESDDGNIPDIYFEKDEVNDILTVTYVSEKVLWSDIKVEGDCDKSLLGRYVNEGDQIIDCIGLISIYHKPTGTLLYTYKFEPEPKLPTSLLTGNLRDVSPKDEGVHANSILNKREWWYYTVVFDEDSELSGWTATIGFMHMAWGDFRLTFKPDIHVVTLHSPDGKEYGGLINKQRREILGIFGSKTFEAKTPGVDLKFDSSWALGKAPEWHVHAEDKNIDKESEIIMDLDFFAPSYPLWIESNKLVDKGEGGIASYIFTGCEVSGTVTLDGLEFKVNGTGHHEHSWSLGVGRFFVKGWDWCHMTLDNGWNIYYSKYYLTNQILNSKTSIINPYATIVITSDQGETLTVLDNVDITAKKSDRLFLLLKMPSQFIITAKPKIAQVLLRTYNILLNIDIEVIYAYSKIWKFPTYVGMKIGMSSVTGSIKWTDDDGTHEVELDGTGTIWNMRRF
jgi:predicted secreted hydrolase